MASDATIFARARQQTLDRHPGDESGQLLHAPGLKSSGTLYAFATSEDLVVKLATARVTDLVAVGVGWRRERPLKQGVRLRLPQRQPRVNYLLEARAFVANRPAT